MEIQDVLYDDVRSATVRRCPSMMVGQWSRRLARMTSLLSELRYMGVPDWALWFLAGVAVPIAVDESLASRGVDEREAEWLTELRAKKAPAWLRVAVLLWRRRFR